MDPHYHVATNVLIVKNQKILMSRRQNTGWADGLLCIPGGHVEPTEFPIEAAIRELKEELGIRVKKSELVFLCTEVKHVTDRFYVSVEFTLRTAQEPINNEPDKCSELVWVDPNNLPDDVIPNFRNIIEKSFLNSDQYLEFINS